MRGVVVLAFLMAGCVGGSGGLAPLFTAIGTCETEDMSEQDDDISGTFWECTNVNGAGRATITVTCASDEIGFIGVEYEDGNSTVAMEVTRGDGTMEYYNVTSNDEEFLTIGGNERVTANLESPPEFYAEVLRYGWVCFPEDYLSG